MPKYCLKLQIKKKIRKQGKFTKGKGSIRCRKRKSTFSIDMLLKRMAFMYFMLRDIHYVPASRRNYTKIM